VPRGKDFVQTPQAPREVSRDVQHEQPKLRRHLVIELMKRARRHLKYNRWLARLRGRGSRHRFQDAHFAEKVARSQDCQDCLVASPEVLDNTDGAAADEKHAVVGLAFARDDGLGGDGEFLGVIEKKGARLVIKAGENRD